LALALVGAGCVVGGRGGGRGGGGGGDDDDSAGSDDDDATDDDDAANPLEATGITGLYRVEYDFSAEITNEFGWADCLRDATLIQGDLTLRDGCPGCVVLLNTAVDGITTDCDEATGISADRELPDIFYGATRDGTLNFFSWSSNEWELRLPEGELRSGEYSGTQTVDRDTEFEGTTYEFTETTTLQFDWSD